MRYFFFVLTYFFIPAAWGTEVALSRHFMITTCYTGQKCVGPIVKDIEHANVKLPLSPYAKGSGPEQGLTGFDENSITEQGIPFHSEIRITTTEDGSKGYGLYIMLRSGPTKARHGIVRKIKLKSLDELELTLLSDKPIAFKGGTLKAQLVVGPTLEVKR